MKKKLLVLSLLLFLLCPQANANIIFPHLVLINFYSLFLFGIPIIFTETFYYKRCYNSHSVWFWLLSVIVINLISSFLGMIIFGVSSPVIPNFIEYTTNFILIFLQFFVCCVLSWLAEYVFLLGLIKLLKKQVNDLFKNAFFANLYSYIVIFVLYSIIFYIPITHKIFFYGF